ncbi:MAG: methyl-accepting chemotaxis protein, partial [Ramlibacter sp.]
MKNFTAETFLNSLILALLLGIAGLAGFSFYAYQQSNERAASTLKAGVELGVALASARAADLATHSQPAAAQPAVARGRKAAAAGQRQAAVRAQQHQQLVRKLLEDARQGLAAQGADTAAVDEALARPLAPAEKWTDVGPAVEESLRGHAARLAQEGAQQARRVGLLVAAVVLLGIVLSLRVRYWIRRSNGRPLWLAARMVEQVAAGDLTVKSEGMDQLHTRKLAGALDGMTTSLRTLVSEVASSARTVADT